MSRQEKKTRIRVVPPKLQLRGQDALTGSYPTNVRFSLDGRTGNYKIGYNDIQTVVFGSRSNGTSWQDNMIGYWTMQRLGPTSNATGSITFESEISARSGISVYPYMDYNFIPDSKFLYFGVSESYAHEGKAYNVNLNEANPTNGIEYPTIVPNKSYDFKPNYSVYGVLEGDPMIAINSTYPLLAQNLDSNKNLFAFTGSFGSVYPKSTYQPFTIAGWFYYNNTANNASNANILVAGPCRKEPWNIENVDYYAAAVEDGSGGLSFQVAFISSSYSTKSMQLDTNSISNLVGNWFHFAFTYDGATSTSDVVADDNTIKVYVDGNRVAPLNFSDNGTGFSGYNTNDPIYYGISSTYLACLNSNVTGSLAEMALFNRVLTQQEIVELYTCQVPWNKKRRIIAGTSIDLDNDPYPVDAEEYMTTFNRDGMLVTGSIVKGVGDNSQWVHFSPGQEMQPFHDEKQFAADAKGLTIENPFFATGSAETLVGEGFSSPLWSKNKIVIPLPVVSASSIGPVKGKFSSSPSAFENTYNSPMGYYNFDRKVWEPIGVGLNFNTSTLRNAIEYIPIGFFNGLLFIENAAPLANLHNMGYCGSDFGFPYHPKYHATGSQTLDMSQYITEPFLFEKAVITLGEVSWEIGSINLSNVTSNITGSINTFFILNQRRNQSFSYSKGIVAKEYGESSFGEKTLNTTLPCSIPLSKDQYDSSEVTYVDTIRDILGFSQIYSFASGSLNNLYYQDEDPLYGLTEKTSSLAQIIPVTSNDIVLESQTSNVSGANWNVSNMSLSMSLCVPSFGSLPPKNITGLNRITTRYNGTSATTDAAFVGFDGSRTGLNFTQLSSQGLNNDLFAGTNAEPAYTAYSKTVAPNATFNFTNEKHKINPYIIYPTDRLIIGCQAPVSINPVTYTTAYGSSPVAESVLTFNPDTNENRYQITIYGSYIKQNKEYNDGTNQLLSSETIHEVIE